MIKRKDLPAVYVWNGGLEKAVKILQSRVRGTFADLKVRADHPAPKDRRRWKGFLAERRRRKKLKGAQERR